MDDLKPVDWSAKISAVHAIDAKNISSSRVAQTMLVWFIVSHWRTYVLSIITTYPPHRSVFDGLHDFGQPRLPNLKPQYLPINQTPGRGISGVFREDVVTGRNA